MTNWAEDPNLFIHKGKDGVVHVLRCIKETTLSSSSMLMKPEDFIDEGEVINHLSLHGGYYNWDKNKFEALIDYIYSKHFMVNCHGFVIAELATDEYQKVAAPAVSSILNRKKKAVAAIPVQLVYIRALDILDMVSYGSHPRAIPSRMVKYLQYGTVVQTEPNPIEMKLIQDLAIKSKEVETLQQELAEEKSEMDILIERVAELEESAKNLLAVVPPLPAVRIYTKADTRYSLTIRNGEHVIFRPNNKSDPCQHWMKDEKYGASVKDVCGNPGYALVNKFSGQAIKPSSAGAKLVELVPFNPNVLDESILWTEVELDDGYRAIRKATDPSLNMDGSCETGGVGDGTNVHLWNWWAGDNQKWNIVPHT